MHSKVKLSVPIFLKQGEVNMLLLLVNSLLVDLKVILSNSKQMITKINPETTNLIYVVIHIFLPANHEECITT